MEDERMSQEDYDKLCAEVPNVGLVRPFGIDKEWHRDQWRKMGITVLICQRRTLDVTKITLSSLLRFYPDIPILVIDDDSEDGSLEYLKWMAVKHPNIELYERKGKKHSHGEMFHEAFSELIKTPYVLTMDSDVNVERGGWIELMLEQIKGNSKMYATGTRMLVSRKGEAIGAPYDFNDVLHYAHISCAIYHIQTYKTLARFYDHGAMAYANMIDAERRGFEIGYFPVDKYVSHLSGASWCVPPTIWKHDFDVPLRPRITFIITLPEQFELLKQQTDHDFDIVTKGNHVQAQFNEHTPGSHITHNVGNYLYDIRFKVIGEYVCELNEYVIDLSPETVAHIKSTLIETNAPETLQVWGLIVVERKKWQNTVALV